MQSWRFRMAYSSSNRRDVAKITENLSRATFSFQKVQWFRLPDTEKQARQSGHVKFWTSKQKKKTYMEVTDQENHRTHTDKNPDNIVIQQTNKTPEQSTSKRKAPSSIPVSLPLSPTKCLRAELEVSPDASLSSPSLSGSQFDPVYSEVHQSTAITAILLHRHVPMSIMTTSSTMMWLSRKQPKLLIKIYWNICQRNHLTSCGDDISSQSTYLHQQTSRGQRR